MEDESNSSNNSTYMVRNGIPTHGGKYVQYNVLGNLFEVSSKYAPPIQPIGRGAYGIVWYYSLYICLQIRLVLGN